MNNDYKPKGFRDKLFDIPFQFFKNHLDRENNCRILFSGKFGMGKTYFLDHFFKIETQKEKLNAQKYRAIHLFPVNYSISATEDIFGYLKYDIVSSFLVSGVKIEKKDFELVDYAPFYVKKNLSKIIAKLISMTPGIGKPLEDVIEKYNEIKADFEAKAKKATSDEQSSLEGFLDKQENIPGSLYENDVVTKIISSILSRLKDESKCENVLVIDDLDRIDPEHVFRILNIFAAHLDTKVDSANKLGFDKVIIVCDIHNLQSIFRTKYGIGSDFNGYIDKFYSYEVFDFDNRQIVSDIASEAFLAVRFIPNTNRPKGYFENVYFKGSTLATVLLIHLVEHGYINLRTLINRIAYKPITPGTINFVLEEGIYAGSEVHPLLFHMNILRQLAGGYRNLKDNIHKIPKQAWRVPRIEYYCNQMLYYINYHRVTQSSGPHEVEFNQKTLMIADFKPHRSSFEELKVYLVSSGNANQVEYRYSVDEFKMLLEPFIEVLERVKSDTPF